MHVCRAVCLGMEGLVLHLVGWVLVVYGVELIVVGLWMLIQWFCTIRKG